MATHEDNKMAVDRETTGLQLFDVVVGRLYFLGHGVDVGVCEGPSGLGLGGGHGVGPSPMGSRS
jgi:hypothetical protein